MGGNKKIKKIKKDFSLYIFADSISGIGFSHRNFDI